MGYICRDLIFFTKLGPEEVVAKSEARSRQELPRLVAKAIGVGMGEVVADPNALVVVTFPISIRTNDSAHRKSRREGEERGRATGERVKQENEVFSALRRRQSISSSVFLSSAFRLKSGLSLDCSSPMGHFEAAAAFSFLSNYL